MMPVAVAVATERGAMRRKYGLQLAWGEPPGAMDYCLADFCAGVACAPCALAQQAAEMEVSGWKGTRLRMNKNDESIDCTTLPG